LTDIERARQIIVAALAIGIGACTPSGDQQEAPKTISQHFALCEMDAIKTTGWKEGDFYSQAGRYLYACMRAAGYELISPKKPDGTPDLHAEGPCQFGDMQRIVLPECYKPYPESTAMQFGRCEVEAIKNMDYHQGDYDGPAARYLYACMRAAGYELKSHKSFKEGYCTHEDRRITVLPECYQPQKN
jgi:hypothetical protein